MLGPVQPTPYDLQFSLLGIPVRVLPWFWLMAAVLGFNTLQIGPEFLLAWMGIVFASILVHELGHAIVASLFGYPPRIFLYHFGGLAMFTPGYNYTQGKSILITLAGPGIGFLAAGIIFLVRPSLVRAGVIALPQQGWSLSWFIVEQLLYVNVFWGLINLLPVLPLDGGQICRDICTSLSARKGQRWATIIALVTAAGVALLAIRAGQMYLGILFGVMAFQNFEQLQQRNW